VVLNSRGEASIFWGAGPYKVTLRTSADALIWTQDNLYPPFTAAEPLKLYSGGNATTPELSWVDDTNSGFYLIGEDNIGLSLGGTKRWDYAATGSTLTGSLTVSGAATLQNTLAVTGATTLTGNVSGVGDYVFTATTTQRILKSGSDLLIGTTDANPVTIFTNNVGRMSFPAAGTVSMLSNRVTDVTNPTSAQDAATKAYVDASVGLVTTTLTAGANWTLGTGTVVKRGGVATVFIVATAGSVAAGWGAIGTVPVGFRPAYGTVSGYGQCVDASGGPVLYPCRIGVTTAGDVFASSYDDGTSETTLLFTIAAGDSASVTLTYVVAE
jgi:hypothetical protein